MISRGAVQPAAARADWPVLAALALLWSEALWRWQAVWLNLPDYGFGWAVPVLAAFLAWERWPDRPPVVAEAGARAWPDFRTGRKACFGR